MKTQSTASFNTSTAVNQLPSNPKRHIHAIHSTLRFHSFPLSILKMSNPIEKLKEHLHTLHLHLPIFNICHICFIFVEIYAFVVNHLLVSYNSDHGKSQERHCPT